MPSLNTIQHGRYNRALQKLLSLKGPAQVTEVSGEIFPMINMFYGAEMRFLESWDRWWSSLQVGAAAAINSGSQIRNPAGSNVAAVIEKLCVAPGAALATVTITTNSLGSPSGDLNNTGATISTMAGDARGQRTNPTCILSGSNSASVPALPIETYRSAVANALQMFDVILTDIQELTLLPGTTLRFINQTVNSIINVSILWRERVLEESERQ